MRYRLGELTKLFNFFEDSDRVITEDATKINPYNAMVPQLTREDITRKEAEDDFGSQKNFDLMKLLPTIHGVFSSGEYIGWRARYHLTPCARSV